MAKGIGHIKTVIRRSSNFSDSPKSREVMDWSMPGFPVHHQLLELAQTHLHRTSDAIPPSHPLSSSSPPAFSLAQHQGLIQWVSSSHQVMWCPSIRVSASASVPPMNTQDWFLLGLTGLILQSKGLSRVFSNNTVQKHQFFSGHFSLSSTLTSIHGYWKNHSIDLCWKVMFLIFNMLSSLVIDFLLRSKNLLISWLQSPSAVILEPPK